MSDKSFVAVCRDIFDHQSFAPEPFTEREAWVWMIMAAAWEDKRVWVGRSAIELRRGELAFSLRFMAEKFKWTDSRVRRFLERRENDAQIEVKSTHKSTHVTICNYDKYQMGRRSDDTTNDAQNEDKTTQRRTNNNKTIDDVVDARARGGKLVTPEALQLTDKLLIIAGHDLAFYPPGWATAALRVQTWLTEGWAPEIIVATVKKVSANKTGPPANSINFFERAIAEEIARQAAPLPNVEVRQAESITVYHGQQNNSVSAVAKRLAEQFERQSGDDFEGDTSAILRLPAR